jgi:NMD protein affecting ribosome stability and mRNA decay
MKGKVAKINKKGFPERYLVMELNSIGVLAASLNDWDKIEIETSKYCDHKLVILKTPDESSRFILVKNLGDFQEEISIYSDDVFEIELIEMDEKEIEELPEFDGWEK